VLAKEVPKNQWDDEDVEEEEVKQSWEEEDKPNPVSACKCPMRGIDRFRVSLLLSNMV
jgi:translation initiation factor 3 subunit J